MIKQNGVANVGSSVFLVQGFTFYLSLFTVSGSKPSDLYPYENARHSN